MSRTGWPGSRRVTAAVLAGAVVVLAAVPLAFVLARAGAPAGSLTRYGSLPAWLRTSSTPVGRVVTASAAHPWLAIEGDMVRADVTRSEALVTVVGPAVPQEGVFPVPATSPCTFTTTFARTGGSVPLQAGSPSWTSRATSIVQWCPSKVAARSRRGLPRVPTRSR